MYCVALALPHLVSGGCGFAYLAGAAPGAKMHPRFGAQKMQRVKTHSFSLGSNEAGVVSRTTVFVYYFYAGAEPA